MFIYGPSRGRVCLSQFCRKYKLRIAILFLPQKQLTCLLSSSEIRKMEKQAFEVLFIVFIYDEQN